MISCHPTRTLLSAAVNLQLDALVARHAEVNAALMAPNLDSKQFIRLSREASSTAKSVQAISEYRAISAEAAGLRAVASEADEKTQEGREMAELARSELAELEDQLEPLEESLRRLLIPRDEADARDCILEFRAGTGGDEAGLFASELMDMYMHYCATRGWRWSPLSVSRTEVGGLREASVGVSGEGAYGRLKHECGVHRVQRVPATEGAGRVHTSTASVAVMPEAEEVDLEIRAADLRIDTYRSQGPGGQSVNTTDSAVRITHMPSGIVVAMQDERSQLQNRVKAMRVLRSRLFEADRQRKQAERSAVRLAQIGRSERSERVRTFNFTQNRVTDHRINLSKFDMDSMMRGEMLDEFIDGLIAQEEEEGLLIALQSTDAVVGNAENASSHTKPTAESGGPR